MQLTELEKGYIAGIIDGEGSICLTRVKQNEFRAPTVSVASTTYEILQYLKDKVGGGVISSKAKVKDYHKDSWAWVIRRNLAIELLENIQDYLLIPEKKYRANLITSKYKAVTRRNGKYTEEQLAVKLAFEEEFFAFEDKK